MASALLEIGTVCRPHGLRGELRVKLHDPGSSALEAVRVLWTEKDSEHPQKWSVKWCRGESNGFFIVAVDGIIDRTAAEALTRHKLLVARNELPALEPGEFYLADLPGCEAQLGDGTRVGIVTDVVGFGAQPQLLIERPDRAPALVPIVDEILTAYDPERRLVVIAPPDGLLDLDRN